MKIYYERTISCECGDSQRQTTTRLPLDRIGNSLNKMHIEDFIYRNGKCKSSIKFTSWILQRKYESVT